MHSLHPDATTEDLEALRFERDLSILGRAAEDWQDRSKRHAALRVLLKRFGSIPTRKLIESAAPQRRKLPWKISIRARPSGLTPRKIPLIIRDKQLTIDVIEHQIIHDHSREKAIAEIVRREDVTVGEDRLKQIVQKGIRDAKKRGSFEPRGLLQGWSSKLRITLEDLKRPGRPKKG